MSEQETTELKQENMSQEDREKKFLTDVSEKTVWTATKSGHKCSMNLVETLAPNYFNKLNELKDQETTELFGYTFKYYAPKNEDGSLRQDTNKQIYRFLAKKGSGGTFQKRPTGLEDIFEGDYFETQALLGDKTMKWDYKNSIGVGDKIRYVLVRYRFD